VLNFVERVMKIYQHLNTEPTPLIDEGGLPPSLPQRKTIDVRGRREHEAFLKDPNKCAEHGLDIVYETMIYLKRWGAWLDATD